MAIQLNNPATVHALQLQTPDDYHMIGWAPRYLVKDLFQAISAAPEDICVTIVKMNPSPAPLKQRVLVELKGHWPAKYEPMAIPEFQLLKVN